MQACVVHGALTPGRTFRSRAARRRSREINMDTPFTKFCPYMVSHIAGGRCGARDERASLDVRGDAPWSGNDGTSIVERAERLGPPWAPVRSRSSCLVIRRPLHMVARRDYLYNFTHHAVYVPGRGARRVAPACDVDDGRAIPFYRFIYIFVKTTAPPLGGDGDEQGHHIARRVVRA